MNIFSGASLVELLRSRAHQQPLRPAYIFLTDGEQEEVSLNYEELDRQARAVGALLRTLGAAGERVLLLYPQGLEYLIAFWGCLYAGAVAVPAYPPRFNQSLDRILSIATNSAAKVALTLSSVMSKIEPLLGQESGWSELRWIVTDRITADLAGQWQDPLVERRSLALIQYTSGSTSAPKGVMLSHGNLLSNHEMLQSALRHPASAPYVSWLPLFHDMGLIGSALQALYVGVPCVLMSPLAFLQRPFRWLQAISRYKAATSGGPNFAYELCAQTVTSEQKESIDLSSWTLAFNGAEPVRQETLDRFSEAFAGCGFRREALYPCYGLAEAAVFVSGGLKGELPIKLNLRTDALERNRVTLAEPVDEDARLYVSSGRTWLDQKISVVNPETLNTCPPGEVGEVWVSGPNVAVGYWNHPEATERTFRAMTIDPVEGQFLRTGDLGFLKDDQLFITGRLKDLIIIDGSNHYPQDIELTVERSHPAIRRGGCAAFSVEVNGEERLVVVAEVTPGHMPDLETSEVAPSDAQGRRSLVAARIVSAIRQAVAEQHELSVYAVSLLKRGGIQKTSSGKVQRHACRNGFLTGTLRLWEE